MSPRPSTGKHASPPGAVCGPVAGCSPRGHSVTLLSEGRVSVPETDELACGGNELDDYRTQLGEGQVERDRLRVELRDALDQVEYWRTLAEYRKTMLDEQRDQRRQSRYFLGGPPS